MIRNCIIYKAKDEQPAKEKVTRNDLRSAGLRECLKASEGAEKKEIDRLIRLTRKERLGLEDEDNLHYIFSLDCDFRTRRLVAAGDVERPFVPVTSHVWVGRKDPFVVTFDSGRTLSSVAINLVSYALRGEPAGFQAVKMNKRSFEDLREWVTSPVGKRHGKITRVTMKKVVSGTQQFKEIVLGAKNLHSSALFKDLFDSSEAVSNMTFVTPPLKSGDRPFCCRISHWGGITIYTSDALPSEISELLGQIQQLL